MLNVVVTGGSRGLGLAIARRLRTAGYRVIAIARHEGELASAIERGGDEAAGALHFRSFDLGQIGGIADLVKGIHKEFGPIYGLVNNAAVGTSGILATMHDAQIERVVRVNTLSPLVLTKHVVRSMMAAGAGGRIVTIASIAGLAGFKGLAAYSATKASLIGFSRSLAREIGAVGITVNAVAPGFIDTDMTRGLTEQQRAQIIRRSALGRLADVDDIANAVKFLMSDEAKTITGTVMTIDGGTTA
jgi:3-oxoacyl-[acyl-carrier protein] reductase